MPLRRNAVADLLMVAKDGFKFVLHAVANQRFPIIMADLMAKMADERAPGFPKVHPQPFALVVTAELLCNQSTDQLAGKRDVVRLINQFQQMTVDFDRNAWLDQVYAHNHPARLTRCDGSFDACESALANSNQIASTQPTLMRRLRLVDWSYVAAVECPIVCAVSLFCHPLPHLPTMHRHLKLGIEAE